MLFKSKDNKAPPIPTKIESDDLQKQVAAQQQIIQEMFKLVIMISEHKNYGFIQRQRDLLQLLLDKLPKL